MKYLQITEQNLIYKILLNLFVKFFCNLIQLIDIFALYPKETIFSSNFNYI